MKTVAIIQARMGSSRLPGKVLEEIGGQPMLALCVSRVARARRVNEVVVATTTHARDEPLVELCRERGWHCFRGSELDVLGRYYGAAKTRAADRVVRVTSDCPLIDPDVIDPVVAALDDDEVDYSSNTLEPRTYPRGLDVEAFRFTALETAWQEDANPAWREHVTPFIRRNPERFRLRGVYHSVDCSQHRWTVDTPEDLELIRTIVDEVGVDDLDWQRVLDAVERHPSWSAINRHVRQRSVDG